MAKNHPGPPSATGIQGRTFIPRALQQASDMVTKYHVIRFRAGAVKGVYRDGDMLVVDLSKDRIVLRKPAIITVEDQFTFVVRRPLVSNQEVLEIDTRLQILGEEVKSEIVSGRDLPDWFPRPN